MMITSTGVKILVGISLHPDENKELISWAINVLAQPNDCIVAIHVLGELINKTTLNHILYHILSISLMVMFYICDINSR